MKFDYVFIIGIISYVLFIASLVFIPLKRKNVVNMAGKCLLSLPRKKYGYFIGVDVVAVVLITLIFFIRYSPLVTVVLCGCGVLGSWIIAGEAALGPKNGLYENGMIFIGKYIPYDDIVTFPIFNLPKYEQKNHPGNVLALVSGKYGSVEIAFDSDSDCQQVVRKLKELGLIK